MSVSQRVSVALLLGGAFLALRYLAVGLDLFADWSWMVGVLLVSAPLCLYVATNALRRLLPHLDRRLPPGADARYRAVLFGFLTDGRMAAAGGVFGILNCAMGFAFGPPNVASVAGAATYYGGLFVLGIVCGMAAYGIYSIIQAIEAYFGTPKLNIDFTAPDRCGGLRVLGQAIVTFAAVTLVMGVLIALYITVAEWRHGNLLIVRVLMAVWLALPFVLSLIVLLWPALAAHAVLTEYKENKDYEMQGRLCEIREKLTNGKPSPEEREALHASYDYQTKLRSELYRMRTWPFSLAQGAEYVTFFVANGLVSVPGLRKVIGLFS